MRLDDIGSFEIEHDVLTELHVFERNQINEVIIPCNVEYIGKNAFADCINLTSITIPDSVTGIGREAFKNCSSLTSVNIPDSVTSTCN